MAQNQNNIEMQLIEAGNDLLNLLKSPPSTNELLTLLDKAEHLLANVEQAPSTSMQDALFPLMKALIRDDLLKHSDMDVKVSVGECFSGITRIMAPDAPYNDDHMKEYFELIVAAFESLSLTSGHRYNKAISILDTVARSRSFLLMLDLECDKLVAEMFQHFFKVIRSNHPQEVIRAMETIMTMIIEESQEVSLDLLGPLLASVMKENKSRSPMSWKLGEKILTNCAAKLKPYLKEAVQSTGIALDDYPTIVASIYQSHSHFLGIHHGSESGEHVVNKLANEAGSSKPAQVEKELSVGAGTIQPLEHCSLAGQQAKSIDAPASAEAEGKSTIEPVPVPSKRRRRPNSLLKPEEGYDYSWMFRGTKTPKAPRHVKHPDEGSDRSSSKMPVSEKATSPLRNERVTKPLESASEVGEGIGASSQTQKLRLPEKVYSKRGRPKKNDNMMSQAADPTPSSVSKGNNSRAQADEKGSQLMDISLEAETLEQIKREEKQQKRHLTEASENMSKTASRSPNSDRNNRKETLVYKRKKKHSMKKEEASEMPHHGGNLVGHRIKVWWPLDKTFYEGVVDSYDPIGEKHKVLYVDGDVEVLNLREECWKLIGDDALPDQGQETGLTEPENVANVLKKERGKAKLESGKKQSANLSKERSGGGTIKYGGKTVNAAMVDKAVQVDISEDDATRTDDNMKEDDK
ncbi:uncharacterized protein LOC120007780 isoform X2 [Tripterygium wilfordii]|uniref:uncharacterized protein LOC120007780 isoform X2 n=1 Tax=Tripterygium wilfordii TaxID=458696 RepID=UPI0018F81CA0|nr:uncharacterized protein LOC120007780 isoform X2 [Tripterygium wilfordii]